MKDYKVKILNEPRPGKKLLVLDIDYTLFGKTLCCYKYSDLIILKFCTNVKVYVCVLVFNNSVLVHSVSCNN